MPFSYQSGQEIQKGDRVLYHDEPAEIEFVADRLVGDPVTDWHVRESGGGIMVAEAKNFGHVFISNPADDEDLVFVSRKA